MRRGTESGLVEMIASTEDIAARCLFESIKWDWEPSPSTSRRRPSQLVRCRHRHPSALLLRAHVMREPGDGRTGNRREGGRHGPMAWIPCRPLQADRVGRPRRPLRRDRTRSRPDRYYGQKVRFGADKKTAAVAGQAEALIDAGVRTMLISFATPLACRWSTGSPTR